MTVLLANSFIPSLARLGGQEQKHAKLTALDLQTEPTGLGSSSIVRAIRAIPSIHLAVFWQT